MGSGVLEVQLMDARGLGKTDILSNIDPYVAIQFRSQERKSSVAKEQGGNPVWNEIFKFRVQYLGTANQHKLILRIMDKDTFSSDDFVGEATINVTDLIALGVEKGFEELRPCKYNVVLADRTYCGEIRVGVTFTRKEEEKGSEEELGGWKHSSQF